MTHQTQIHSKVVIVGGGILGLWLLHLAHKSGIKALLIEKTALGSFQSIASQGMIHGGQRYNLLGKISKHAKMIAKLRDYWLDCLNGKADVDLTRTKKLAEKQYLVSKDSILNQFSLGLAKIWMQNRMQEVNPAVLPEWLSTYDYHIYELFEPVLRVDTLIQDLTHQLDEYILKGEIKSIQYDEKKVKSLICDIDGEEVEIIGSFFCFTAGVGNAKLLQKMNLNPTEVMQLRPLRQFIVYGELPEFYGHFLGLDGVDARPSLSISTHPISKTEKCWYIGGKIAIDSLDSSESEAKKLLLARLKIAFPKLDSSHSEVAVLDINRAEPKTVDFLLPDKSEPIKIAKNAYVAFPIKLTLTPLIATELTKIFLDKLKEKNKSNKKSEQAQQWSLWEAELKTFLKGKPHTPIANYPWQTKD